MTSLSTIFIIAVIAVVIENVILVKLLKSDSFVNFSKKAGTAFTMSTCAAITVTVSSVLSWVANNLVLASLKFKYLHTIVFVIISALMIFAFQMLLKHKAPSYYNSLKIHLPFFSANCSILCIVFVNITKAPSLLFCLLIAPFCVCVFTLVVWMFGSVNQRTKNYKIPRFFKGMPMEIVTASLLSLAFLGLKGINF